MKKINLILYLFAAVISFSSCNDDDDDGVGGNENPSNLENQFVFSGETFPLKLSTISAFSYGENENDFFEIFFATTAYNEESNTFEEESFQLINFEILSENDELEEKTYNFSDPVVPGAFSDISGVSLNVNDNLVSEEDFEIIAGSITIIEITDSTIEATFEGTASSYAEGEREVEFAGHYKGSYIED